MSRNRLAIIAFLGHGFGLRLSGYRFSARLFRQNIAALALSLAGAVTGAALAPRGEGWLWGLGAWSVGHVIWGTYLALHVWRERAEQARDGSKDASL